MSDLPPGPGYWKASDGNWYPPEAHPDYRGATAPAGGGGPYAAQPAPGSYPVWFEYPEPPRKIANWRALAHIFMLIPHFIVNYVLGAVGNVVGIISWFAILFTGRLPEGLANFQVMVMRYSQRMLTFALLLHDEYPPFEFDTVTRDPGTTPGRTSAVPQLENRNRLTCFFRIIMVIPHYIVLAVLGIGAFFAYVAGWFAVLFTGRMPDGIAKFLLGMGRWGTRVQGYYLLLTDEYPPFSMD